MTDKTDNEQVKIQSGSDDEFQTIEIKKQTWQTIPNKYERDIYKERNYLLKRIEDEKENVTALLLIVAEVAINENYIKHQRKTEYFNNCTYLKQFIKISDYFVVYTTNAKGENEERKIPIKEIPYLINGNDFQRLFLEVAKKMKWGTTQNLNYWYLHTFGLKGDLYLGFIQPIDIAKELIIYRELTMNFAQYKHPITLPKDWVDVQQVLTIEEQHFYNTFVCINKRITDKKKRVEVKQKLLDVLQTLQSNDVFNADYSINGEKINEYITNKSETIQGQIKGVLVPFILNKAGLENQTKKAGKNSYLYGVIKAIEQDTNIKDIGKAISNKISPVTNKFSQALEDFCK